MDESLVLVQLAALLVRLLVGQFSHSGQGRPPMYGDYEAQRHWMEVTRALPVGDWYRHCADNDLLYWGLDYPPLTAYVSWLLGAAAEVAVPQLVALHSSRGYEGLDGKLFMRATVLLSDLLVLFPSVALLAALLEQRGNLTLTLTPSRGASDRKRKAKRKSNDEDDAIVGPLITAASFRLLSVLLMPSLLLIDHGHFQYNGVSLGLALLGSMCILTDRDCYGSALFCLSLNFKQMSLYYSPVFFVVLVRKICSSGAARGAGFALRHFAKVAATVVVVFALLWAPFCIFPHSTCADSLMSVLSRQFPFSRGIFEDKVANLWYASSVIVDLRDYFSSTELAACSLTMTLLLLLPMLVNVLREKQVTAKRMVLALVSSSLAFFLASFQVHEKSLLLALLPASLLVDQDFLAVSWFQALGAWTMFPLLAKDELRLPYSVCVALYLVWNAAFSKAYGEVHSVTATAPFPGFSFLKRAFVGLSALSMITLHICELVVEPPRMYPDVYPSLFAIFGAANLCVAYVYFTAWLIVS